MNTPGREWSVLRPAANWDHVYPMQDALFDVPSMSELAQQGESVELMIDMALERDFKMFFRQPLANENQDHVLEMIKHPRSVVTFSDSGAHVAQIMDSSLQTHRQLGTGETSAEFRSGHSSDHIRHRDALGLHDRGLVRQV